jgi:3-phosphoshikimate 1-carboxyvinyltransferase
MSVKILNSSISGEIYCPPSKSYAIRLIACTALAKGRCNLQNLGKSNDVINALNIVNLHFADVEKYGISTIILNQQTKISETVFCDESALNARLFPVLKLLHTTRFSVTGKGSLLKRPVGNELIQLKNMGLEINTANNELLPIRFDGGKLLPGKYTIDGSSSSQFVSALLMVMPVLKENSELMVNNISSLKYIELTIDVLKNFNIFIDFKHPNKFIICGNQKYISGDYSAEADWSSAALLFVAGILCGSVSILGLNHNSKQADKDILKIMRLANITWLYSNGTYTVNKSNIEAFDYDFTNSPDLFPAAMILAANANGICKFAGLDKLKIKESNRLKAMCAELSKIGVETRLQGDELVIFGGVKQKFAQFESYNDHRIAMALTIQCLNLENGGKIDNTECINKSYPDFIKDIKNIGGLIYE